MLAVNVVAMKPQGLTEVVPTIEPPDERVFAHEMRFVKLGVMMQLYRDMYENELRRLKIIMLRAGVEW